MKILVVDDDEIVVDIVEHLLTADGHDVTSCHDGREALELLKNDVFQMAILDWELPGCTGVEICRQMRLGGYSNYLYMIMLTAHGSSDAIIEAMSSGADDFVPKPFNVNELKMRVKAGMRVLSLETRDTLIFTLAKLAESRDPETGQHLERVQRYAKVLSQRLAEKKVFGKKVDASFIHHIFLTSPLHDIGKVGIPDAVLLKNGRLEPHEFEIMKTHTILGATTLEEACQLNPQATYLNMAREIALHHHEKFNGKGYPYGLAGDEIPLSARIVALADVYDALTSKRVYKEAYSHDVAKDIIVRDRGQHFDPRIVDAFLESEAKFLEISGRFRNETVLSFHGLMQFA